MSRKNTEIVRRFYDDLLAQGRLEAADELLAPDYIDHDVSQDRRGSHLFVSWLGAFDGAFRNRVIVLEDIAENDGVVSVRWSGSFAHSRAVLSYAATGQTFEAGGVGVFRVEDGRIAERWEHPEGPSLGRQLGRRAGGADHRLDLRALAVASQAHLTLSLPPPSAAKEAYALPSSNRRCRALTISSTAAQAQTRKNAESCSA
jgi:steroid delta-isomerase-like uncharacterized protein